MVRITTSWDDGDVLDVRLSNLLTRYRIRGTFYVSKNYRPNRLTEEHIRDIATYHEIGAHTLTHPDLRTLKENQLNEEILGSKQWLENVIHSQVTTFCYPKGFYNDSAISAVQNAGFVGARTTKLGGGTLPEHPYLIDTTIQVYPFPFRKISPTRYYPGKIIEPYTQRAKALHSLGVPYFSMYSWLSTAKATFDSILSKQGVYHLWGHSWEIEKYGMWDDLEKLLQYIGNRENCSYITNAELLKYIVL